MSEDGPESGGGGFDPQSATDDDKRELLRAVAEDLRGDDTASRQVAAILYRVSDVYDPEEDTDPQHVYRNVKEILRIKEQGGKDPGGEEPGGG